MVRHTRRKGRKYKGRKGRGTRNNKAGATRQELIDLFDNIKTMAEQGRRAVMAGINTQIQRVGYRKSLKKPARKSPKKPARKSPKKPARKSPKKTTRKLIQKQQGPYRPVSPRSQAKLSSFLKLIQGPGYTDMPMQKPARQLLQKPNVGPTVGPDMSGESKSFKMGRFTVEDGDESPKVATPRPSNVVQMGRFTVEDGDESPTPDSFTPGSPVSDYSMSESPTPDSFTPGSPVSDYSMSDSSVSGSPDQENKD